MAAREHVDPHALHDHLDQAVRHGPDYPTVCRGPRRGGRREHEQEPGRHDPGDEAADVGEERDAALGAGEPSDASPSISCSTNQNPRTRTAGTSMSW